MQAYDAAGDEVGDRIEIRLRPSEDGTRLEARIPSGVSRPIEVELSLRFGPDRSEAFFSFDFPALSATPTE